MCASMNFRIQINWLNIFLNEALGFVPPAWPQTTIVETSISLCLTEGLHFLVFVCSWLSHVPSISRLRGGLHVALLIEKMIQSNRLMPGVNSCNSRKLSWLFDLESTHGWMLNVSCFKVANAGHVGKLVHREMQTSIRLACRTVFPCWPSWCFVSF